MSGPMKDLGSGLRSFWHDPAGRSILAVAAAIIGTGTVVYRFVERIPWIDALYFCVITLTTVGYGDISPQTTAGKVFTMVYVIVGIGVFVALASNVAHHLIQAKSRARGDGER